MIILIHGDDTAASRKYLVELKNASKNPTDFNGSKNDLNDLNHLIKTNSLFSEEKNIFIENFFFKKNKELDKAKDLINKNSNLNIVIWEGFELSKSQVSVFPKANVKPFKLPQNLFLFLDSVKPKNVQNVTLFHNALQNSDENFLFSMILRQFRLMLALGLNSETEETQRLAPWQKEKLLRQSKMFTIEELKRIYNNLFEIDLNIKTGIYLNLTRAIDIFLLDI